MSSTARCRLQTLTAWQALREAGLRADQACHKLGLARATIYRWQKRSSEHNLRGLKEDCRRPKRLRTVNWDTNLIEAVMELREHYPRWGKDKLCVLLGREGWQISTSTVGRILAYLKKRGVIHDPPRIVKISSKRAERRPFALRKPKKMS